MSNPTIEVRPVRENERAAWEPLWRAYVAFYESTLSPEIYDITWTRFHDPAEPIFALGAFVDGEMCGIAHVIYHRSCWTAENACYLQDLFVAPERRGLGLGRALIEAVYENAKKDGASRVHWLTHESNATARALYDRLATRSGFIQYRKLL